MTHARSQKSGNKNGPGRAPALLPAPGALHPGESMAQWSKGAREGIGPAFGPDHRERLTLSEMQRVHGNQSVLRMLGNSAQFGGQVDRKSSCAGSGECAECAGKRDASLSRQPADDGPSGSVPPIVNDVLRSSGQPLDAGVRAFVEPRFGSDLSGVRVHTDQQAAKSATAVKALAYTVGHHIVFGAGQYSPGTSQGRSLIAHELAHVAQQSGHDGSAPQRISNPGDASEHEADAAAEAVMHSSAPSDFATSVSESDASAHLRRNLAGASLVARACMSKEVCEKKTEKTPEELLKEETGKPENKDKRDKRRAACTSTPPDPSCTADGHGARAVQTEKVLHDWDPERLKFIKQIVVDKDMEAAFGGLTGHCANFMPPIVGGGFCTLIPERLETESAQFNDTMDPTIGGKPRDLWRDSVLRILVHETEHARFDVTTIAKPRAGACKFDDIQPALSEIAAMLVEFPIIFRSTRENVSLKPEERVEMLDKWFTFRITNDRQSFKSTLHTIYCICECADADVYVKKTIDFSTADWSSAERERFHTELNDPKWAAHDLRWPVKPTPAAAASPKP